MCILVSKIIVSVRERSCKLLWTDRRRLQAARQQQPGEFDLSAWNLLHVPVALAGMALLPIILMMAAAGRASSGAAILAFTVLLALLANAAICGVFSNPVDRYQSRLVWLAPFAAVIALARSRAADFHGPAAVSHARLQ